MPEQVRRLARPTASGVLGAIERVTGLTPAGVVVLGVAGLGWLVGWRTGGRVLFLMAYGAAGFVVALALLGRRAPAITAARSDLPMRIREQQTVSVELTVAARRRLTGLVLEEQQHPLVGAPVQLLVPSLRPGQEVRHPYAFTPGLRGVYPVGPLTAVVSDPFGLTRRRVPVLDAVELIVHPSTEGVTDRVLSREWEDPPVRPPVSKPWPTGFEFYGMRDYVEGDDPRRIVWRAVARTGRYMVRESEQGITDRVTIVLDTNEAGHTDLTPSDTFETAVRAVASVAVRHLRDGFLVRIETPEGVLVPGARGTAKRTTMLDALARVQRGREQLAAAIRRVLGDPRRDTHLILVTPHLDHTAGAMLRVLLQRSGSMTFVHVVGEDPDIDSLQRAAALGCEVVELRVGDPLAAVFRRSIGAGIRG